MKAIITLENGTTLEYTGVRYIKSSPNKAIVGLYSDYTYVGVDRRDYDYIMACKMVAAKRNYFLTGDVQPVYEVLAELHREY